MQNFPKLSTAHLTHLGLGPSSQSVRSRGGFSYLTVIVVLAMLGIAGGVAFVFTSQLVDIRRERQSRDELADIKQAIIGNTNYVVLDSRGDFGYIGNMGSLPSDLEDLYKKGSQPAYAFSTAKIVGAGWKGPYITPLLIENVDSLKKDPFGNDYVYSTTEDPRLSDGEAVVAKITSKGADGTLGTSDDRFVEILKREVFATVTGTVTSPDGAALEDAAVTLNIPASGALTTRFATTDSSGNYSFSDVPFGVSSVEIEATVDTGSGTTGLDMVGDAITIDSNTKVQFQISNLGEDDVTVTTMQMDLLGAARYYTQIDWSGTVVWDYVANGGGLRGGPGEEKTFSSSQIIVGTAGGTTASSTKLLRVEESSTTATTATLGTGAGTGGQVTITLGPFYTQQSGGGSGSMLSRTFTITFSDGSVITFDT